MPRWSRCGSIGPSGAHRGLQLAAELSLDLGAQPLDSPLVDQELDAGAGALGALALVAVELGDRPADVGGLVRAGEDVQPPAHPGGRAQAAADPHVVADLAVLLDRHQADVVDLVLGAAVGACRHRHLELAGQVGELAVADEGALELLHQRPRVDQLVAVDACQRAADHVSPDVAAGLRERQPDRVQLVQHHRHVLDRQVVQLDVLAGGDVAHAAAVALGQPADRAQLLGADDAVGELHPQHEQPVGILGGAGIARRGRLRGALGVDPVPAEQREVVGLDRVESQPRVAVDVGEHVEAVLAGLDVLDLGQLGFCGVRHGDSSPREVACAHCSQFGSKLQDLGYIW